MGDRFPIPSYRELTKVAKKLGFSFARQAKGSHEIWRRESDGKQTTIPNHGKKAIKRRTFKAILDDLGIHWKKFVEILKDL